MLSAVSSMKAASRDAVCGVSSSSRIRRWTGRRCGQRGRAAGGRVVAGGAAPPSSDSAAVVAVGVRRRPLGAAVPRTVRRLSAAISSPRPMTISSSAVCSISDMRWLETKTVRPSAASLRKSSRTHNTPSQISPLRGSSKSSTGGSPAARWRCQPLPHAQREPVYPAPRRRPREPHLLQHLVHPAPREVDCSGPAPPDGPARCVRRARRPRRAARPRAAARADDAANSSSIVALPPVGRSPEQHAQHRRLARAVRAEEPGDAPRAHPGTSDSVGGGVAVPFGQFVDFDHTDHRLASAPRRAVWPGGRHSSRPVSTRGVRPRTDARPRPPCLRSPAVRPCHCPAPPQTRAARCLGGPGLEREHGVHLPRPRTAPR